MLWGTVCGDKGATPRQGGQWRVEVKERRDKIRGLIRDKPRTGHFHMCLLGKGARVMEKAPALKSLFSPSVSNLCNRISYSHVLVPD